MSSLSPTVLIFPDDYEFKGDDFDSKWLRPESKEESSLLGYIVSHLSMDSRCLFWRRKTGAGWVLKISKGRWRLAASRFSCWRRASQSCSKKMAFVELMWSKCLNRRQWPRGVLVYVDFSVLSTQERISLYRAMPRTHRARKIRGTHGRTEF